MGTKSLLLGVVLALGVGLAAWLASTDPDTAPPDVHSGLRRASASGASAAAAPTPDPEADEPAATQPLPIEREHGAEAAPDVRCTFLGTVAEFDDRVLANAKVELFVGEGARQVAVATVTTDERGHFRCEAPAAAGTWSLRASLDGYVPATLGSVTPDVPIRLRLSRTLRVSGRVTAMATGAGIPGARVESGATHVVCDEQGRFEIEVGTRSGFAELQAVAPGFVERTVQVRLHERQRIEQDFALAATAPLTVVVVDGSNGGPIAGATVRSRADRVVGTTDDTGRIVVEGGEGHVVDLSIAAEGYCSVAWYFTVTEEQLPLVRIPLARTALVEGRVTSATGQPVIAVVGVREIASPDPPASTSDPSRRRELDVPGRLIDTELASRTTSDADGRYRLPVSPRAEPQRVQATLPGWCSAPSRDLVLAPGATVTVDLVLTQEFGSIRGSVLRNGEPTNARLAWRAGDASGTGSAQPSGYWLRDIPPGPVEVSLHEIVGGRLVERVMLTVVATETTHHDFTWRERDGAIAGRVTRTTGAPVADLRITAVEDVERGPRSYRTNTDAEGGYRLVVPAETSYRVTADDDCLPRSLENVRPDGAPADFVLPEIGRLRLRLVDGTTGEAIRSLPGDALSWRPSAGAIAYQRVRTRTGVDDTGLVVVELPVGMVDLCVDLQPEGYSRFERGGVLVALDRPPEEVRLALARGATVRLAWNGEVLPEELRRSHALFLLEDGQRDLVRSPVDGWEDSRGHGVPVWIASPGLSNQMPRFDDAGTATVPGLAPGRYRLRAIPNDLVFEPATFAVGSEGADVELTWRRR